MATYRFEQEAKIITLIDANSEEEAEEDYHSAEKNLSFTHYGKTTHERLLET
tara:strand:- start:186 stop:341 length:156 start_codon:yes stop_codon:yes gene_type:complete